LNQTANLAQIFGPFWPLDPEIHPQNAPEASLRLPFTIKNNSVLFGIVDAKMSCGVDLAILEDANHQRILARDMAFVSAIKYSIPANGAPIGYECDASGLITVQPNGGLSLRKTLETPAGRFRGPLSIIKMCIWIGGTYKLLGIKPETFVSIVFQWPVEPGVNRWNEGPVVRDLSDVPAAELWPPSAAWAARGLYTEGTPRMLRPESVECHQLYKGQPYISFEPDSGKAILRFMQ
jgi:hypothetical protein